MNSPGGLEKIAQAMLAPLKKDLLYEGRIKELFTRYYGTICCKCQKIHETHKWAQEIMYDHPSFSNNLEMLEWLEQRERSKTL